jgi:hypothetical protein
MLPPLLVRVRRRGLRQLSKKHKRINPGTMGQHLPPSNAFSPIRVTALFQTNG